MNQKNINRTILSQFPDAPLGATMFSRFVLYHLMSGNCGVFDSKRLLFNKSKCRSLSPFGEQIPTFRDALPRTTNFDIDSTLMHNTAFTFYRDSLSDSYRQNWLSRDGKNLDLKKKDHQFYAHRPLLQLIKPHLHFCSECVTNDHYIFGVAFWRVLHQLPSIHHCPVHLSPLKGTCQSCGKAQASERDWNLPTHKCPFCQCSIFQIEESRLSSAYSVYLSLCESTIHNSDFHLTQEQRRQKYTEAYQFFGSTENPLTLKNAIDVVLKEWNCEDVNELGNLLGVSFNLNVVRKTLSNDSVLRNPTIQLAILAASISAQNTKKMTKSKDENIHNIMKVESISRYEKWNASLVIATDALKKLGYAPKIANLFLEGKTENYIASSQNISWNKIQELRVYLESMNLINYSQQDYEFHLVTDSIDLRNLFQPKGSGKISNPLKTHRERILSILATGKTSRQQVRVTENTALKWLRKHDAEWLNQFLPTIKISIPDTVQKRTAYRKSILIFMTAHPNTTRTNMDKNLRTQFRWCFLNDTEWFNKVAPRHRSRWEACKFKST